jgi:hypothetical protein
MVFKFLHTKHRVARTVHGQRLLVRAFNISLAGTQLIKTEPFLSPNSSPATHPSCLPTQTSTSHTWIRILTLRYPVSRIQLPSMSSEVECPPAPAAVRAGTVGCRAEIDTSAPFESVREAVDRFGGGAVWSTDLVRRMFAPSSASKVAHFPSSHFLPFRRCRPTS